MHGIIPSCLSLISRFVNVDPDCKRCGNLIESTEHALRDFRGLAAVWNSFPTIQILNVEEMELGDWTMKMVSLLGKEKARGWHVLYGLYGMQETR